MDIAVKVFLTIGLFGLFGFLATILWNTLG